VKKIEISFDGSNESLKELCVTMEKLFRAYENSGTIEKFYNVTTQSTNNTESASFTPHDCVEMSDGVSCQICGEII